MKRILLSVLAAWLIFPNAGYAASKAEIMRVIKQTPSEYCGFEDPDEIKVIRSGGQIYALYGTYGGYVDLPGRSCSTGSGTSMYHLTRLEQVGGRLRVADTKLLDGLNINTRFIDTGSMKINNGVLVFTNREYGEDDANCCPGNVYLNQIRLSDMKVLNRKFIGRKPY